MLAAWYFRFKAFQINQVLNSMKVLLFGDHSGLHSNLKKGLNTIGCEVTVASFGDGWKKIPRDINLSYGDGVVGKISRKVIPLCKLPEFSGYDVVQYINAFYIYHRFFPNEFFFGRLLRSNEKVFLTAAGDDFFYWKYGRQVLRYGPFADSLKYDLNREKHVYESFHAEEFNKSIASKVSGVIPVMYEYFASYNGHPNLKDVVPLPIDTEAIDFRKISKSGKLTIFHGLNRYGFKGTKYILDAFKIIEDRYPDKVELVVDGKMPLEKYLKLMERVDVVIDQTSSYSLGMNGVYALAMGKVVMGGAEPESLNALKVSESPVINIKPCVDDIVSKIEWVIKNRNVLPDLGVASREFCERIHCANAVARQYIDTWSK